MKKIIVGYLIDGKKGGIDKYLLNMLSVVNTSKYQIDFITNTETPELRDLLQQYNSKLYVVHNLKHPVKQYRQMLQIMKENQYDVAYFNISEAFHTIGLLAAWICKVEKRIIHSHSSGCDSGAKTKWVREWLHVLAKNTVIKMANVFVSCSDKAAEWMFPKSVCKSGKVQIVMNGIDISKFVFRPQKRIDVRKKLGWENKKVLLHVGNLTYVKNHDFMLRLIKSLLEEYKDFLLVFVGNGHLEEQIKQRITELGVSEYVKMLGLRDDVSELLQASDYFLLPSFNEGFPISGVEAQVSGNLCLLSDRITKDARLTEHCYFLDIENVEVWKNLILEYRNYEHKEFHNITDKVVDLRKQGDVFEKLFG